jgi:hypothetical protein
LTHNLFGKPVPTFLKIMLYGASISPASLPKLRA